MKVSVIGSGTMGPGIAQVFAQNGHSVTLIDIDDSFLRKGIETIQRNLDHFVQSGLTTREKSNQTLENISTTTDMSNALESSEYIVEAIPEKLELKKNLFRKIESVSSKEAVLASNTSSLSINDIADSMKEPSRVIGTHYLNPPHLVPIVEIVLGKQTSPHIADRVLKILRDCGKRPVLVKDVPGFIHNRLICALLREAMYMAANDIASVEAIDTIVREAFGPRFPLVGVFGLEDMVGLDVLRDVSNQVFPTLDNSKSANAWLEEKVANGKLGIKAGKGFYEWPEGRPARVRAELTQRFVELLKQREEDLG